MRRLPTRDERGAAVVEFALVLPLVLVVLFGVLQYSYVYWSKQTAAATAREAARRMSVGSQWGCTETEAERHAATASVGPVPPAAVVSYPDGRDIGDRVVVTVTLHTLDVGMLPVPDDGLVVETASARIENVPWSPIGCD